jgi:CubicO group peptidase (beta-lactamase class C family)
MRHTQHRAHGEVTPRFEGVRRAFQESFDHHGEVGASLCVWHEGQRVVDLWGGSADPVSGRPWEPNTLTTSFSCTKGLVATCFLRLADQGRFDYDAPLSRYWPELAIPAVGPHAHSERERARDQITGRQLLNHRAGLLGLRAPLTLDDLEDPLTLSARLAAEPLAWRPGEAQGYHAVTFGLYAGELFRRVAGESVGSFLTREVTGPLSADVHLGLPAELEARCAPIIPTQRTDVIFRILPNLLRSTTEGRFFRGVLSGGDAALAFGQPAELGARGLRNYNTSRVRALELPWANAMASARGLSAIYAGLIEGRVVSKEALRPLRERQSWSERDRVVGKPMGFTQGFLKEGAGVFSPHISSFGHPGAGGALGWCDPEAGLAIGYVMNRMGYHVRSPRALRLCEAIYASL